MTEAEKEQALEAARRAAEFRAQLLAERNGMPFSSSAELITEMRRERSEHLADL